MRPLTLLACMAALALTAGSVHAAPGAIDLSYGRYGTATTPLVNREFQTLRVLEVDAAGRAVVAGGLDGSGTDPEDFALVRLMADGALDRSFGTDGVVRTDIAGMNDEIAAIAIQPDGRIVAVGNAKLPDAEQPLGRSVIAVARYTANGRLDPSFGTGGIVQTPVPGSPLGSRGHDVALQPDGRIVVAATATFLWNREPDPGFVVVRYRADGTLDPSFGAGGIVRTQQTPDGSTDIARAIAVDAQGRIVVAGRRDGNVAQTMSGELARYLPDGALDTTFGTGGIALTYLLGAFVSIQDLVPTADGGILTVGTISKFSPSYRGLSGLAVSRYTARGDLDPAFAGGQGWTVVPGTAGGDTLLAMPDGSVFAAGSASAGFALARLTTLGALDVTFGVGGLVVTKQLNDPYTGLTDLAVQPDGRILAAGFGAGSRTPRRLVVARYLGGAGPPSELSFADPAEYRGSAGPVSALAVGDLDGDGSVDLVVGDGDGVGIRRNTGNGTFADEVRARMRVEGAVKAIALGDLDRDGDLDIVAVIGGRLATGVDVLLGRGDGTFEIGPSNEVGPLAHIRLADLDLDGTLDLAGTGPTDTITVALGRGAGSFRDPQARQVAGGAILGELEVVDLDRSGRPDLVVQSRLVDEPNRVSVLLADANGGFAASRDALDVPGAPAGLAVADTNGDGTPDVVTARGDAPLLGSLVTGPHGLPMPAMREASGSLAADIALGDLDGDGLADAALARGGTTGFAAAVVVRGRGDGRFGAATTLGNGLGESEDIALADLDRDGRLDIVVAGGGGVAVHRNTTTLPADRTPPTITHTISPPQPDGTNGWYTTAPTVTFACADAGSGIAGCRAEGNDGPSITLGQRSRPQTATGIAIDRGGNVARATVPGLLVDLSDPVVRCDVPAPSFVQDLEAARLSARVDDAVSGPRDPARQTGADTARLGAGRVAITGFDRAGRFARAWCPYAVRPLLLGTLTLQPRADELPQGPAKAFRTRAVASGALETVALHVAPGSTARRVVVGVYAGDLRPRRLLGAGVLERPAGGAWASVTLRGVRVRAGRRYWIAVLVPPGEGLLRVLDRSGAHGGHRSVLSRERSLTHLPSRWRTGEDGSDGPLSAAG